MQQGYCVKCRKKRDMKSVVKKVVGGKLQLKGKCSVCGTNMSVFAKN